MEHFGTQEKRYYQLTKSFGTDVRSRVVDFSHMSRADREACNNLQQFATKNTGSHRMVGSRLLPDPDVTKCPKMSHQKKDVSPGNPDAVTGRTRCVPVPIAYSFSTHPSLQ